MEKFLNKYLKNHFMLNILLSFLLNLFIESVSRHSLKMGILYLVNSPIIFFYNMLLIFASFSLIFIIKRRIFYYTIITFIWILVGIVNGFMLTYRTTPFNAVDLSYNISEISQILQVYLSNFQIILILVGVVIGVVLFVFFFIFAPKYTKKLNFKFGISFIVMTVIVILGGRKVALANDIFPQRFMNIAYAYQDYGFPYCFLITVFDNGIDMPNGYSDILIDKITKSDGEDTYGDEKPNIIFLQLESFFDITNANDIEFSQDPISYFHKLMSEYSSGYVTVPTIGAGTCNTEFEMITGMNLRSFGAAEYPYKTILREETCESIPYNLKSIGYSTHAIHNNRASFYGRNLVFSNLGFDTFTSVEYMDDTEKNPNGWAKDKILTDAIIDALDSSEEMDYIYTISVQGHGSYPKTILEDYDYDIKIVSEMEDEERKNEIEYYINQINEMDDFIKELVEELSKRDERTILVMYGDHLPALGFTEDELDNHSLYQTPYVIWDNIGLERKEKNLKSYQMGAYVLERLDISCGTLVKFHQNQSSSKSYTKDLRILQYDMLYGERYIYNQNKDYFKPTNLKIGINIPNIENVTYTSGKLVIYGENFTPYSKVYINDKKYNTQYKNNKEIYVELEENLEDETIICVKQVSNVNESFGNSNEYVYFNIVNEKVK